VSRINKASPSIVVRGGCIALATCLALAGCGDSKPVGTVGYVKGFGGLVAADEPRAVLAARDVLSAGGTAADAATTLYFSLAVTLPSTASLGGGGSCVVYSSGRKAAEVVDFPAPPVTAPGTLPVVVPANARGFYLLHARYGKLRWESLLAEPERMAREGVTVSRAFANDLALGAARLAEDPEAHRLFFRADGRVLGEGDLMQNYDLAVVLSGLRRAPGDFYSGEAARRMAAAAQGIGAGLTLNDLSATRPRAGAGATLDIGEDVAMVPASAADVTGAAAAMLKHGVTERLRLVSAAAGAGTEGNNTPGTGFVVLDSFGGGVACSVGANGLFGTGRILPGTGFALAPPPPAGMPPAVPGLVYNSHAGEVHFAATAVGGTHPATALATALVAATDQGRGAAEAIAAASAGLTEAAASRMEAFACGSGSADASRCTVATDPKGFGYAVIVGK
jgi:gamma-glutamyltranspeptidase/glutathione hydrolase